MGLHVERLGSPDFTGKRLLIFIVACNAETTIEKVLGRIPQCLQSNNVEVLIIDDASKDNTFRNGLRGRWAKLSRCAFRSRALECCRYSPSAVSVIPSQSGFKPKSGRSQAWDAHHYGNGKGKSLRYEAQKEFIRTFRDAAGIVLSDLEPPYLNVLLSKPFVAAPPTLTMTTATAGLWHYGKAEAAQLIQGGLDHATPVYALLLPSKHLDEDVQRLPVIQGYSWRRTESANTRAVIMTLTKDTAAPTLDSASRSVK